MNLKKLIKILIIGCGALKLLYKLKGRSVTILRYHSVQDNPDDHEVTIGASIIHSTDEFREHMRLISRHYNPVTMDDVSSYLEHGTALPPYPVVITFDDGYKDNLEIAAPILEEFGIQATFYVIIDSVAEEGNHTAWFLRVRKAFSLTERSSWIDVDGNEYDLTDNATRIKARRAAMTYCGTSIGLTQLERVVEVEEALAVPAFESGINLMMSWSDIEALRSKGHIIGSHTMSHPNLAYVNADDASVEIGRSRQVLENKMGESVKYFAYPNPILSPNWSETTTEILKEKGYELAVTCDVGCVRSDDDPLSLKRMFCPQSPDELRWYIENTMNGFRL